jgi:hypothetical protein
MIVPSSSSPALKLKRKLEVYPDSPKVTAEICNQAQMAAICGGLDFLL